jgi:pimeloyl-ACP methyl ester carboxylesterase
MDLPIGYRKFHKQKFFNYQLNRLYSLGYARLEDIERVSPAIKTTAGYVAAFKGLADEAEAENRLKNAAFYLRAAEFFVPPESPEKTAIYGRFRETFYRAFADEKIDCHEVPYNHSFIPAMRLAAKSAPAKGTLLLFGGFDSLIEEFFCIWRYFAGAGYDVIAFEGPGQGGALRLYGQHFDHDWEKPTAAVLDHFNINQATLIGISMGGYWCIRAAAFENRIKRIVSWSPVYDWMEQIPPFAQQIVHQVVRWRGFMNAAVRLRMKLIPILNHAARQAMYMAGKSEPIDGVYWIMQMNKRHLSSHKVTQDVLLLAGENDVFQPPKLMRKQAAALVNARSVTGRIFTKAEHADMHCQMGNLNLALSEIEAWLNSKM